MSSGMLAGQERQSADQLASRMLSKHGPIRLLIQDGLAEPPTVILLITDGPEGWRYWPGSQALECQLLRGWQGSVTQDLTAAARHVLRCDRSTPAAQALARELIQALMAEGAEE